MSAFDRAFERTRLSHLRQKPIRLWPPSVNSRVHGGRREARAFARFYDSHLATAKGHDAIPSCVSRLSRAILPYTIIWAVILVVVYPLQSAARRARPHVLKKRGKVIAPAVANSNAATAVVFPRPDVRIKASPLHSGPDAVLARTATRTPVCGRLGSRVLPPKTATTRNESTPQGVHCRDVLVSAVANAAPVAVPPVPFLQRLHKQAPEALARYVMGFCHEL